MVVAATVITLLFLLIPGIIVGAALGYAWVKSKPMRLANRARYRSAGRAPTG